MSSPRRVTAPASKSLSHRYCIGAALAARIVRRFSNTL